MTVWDAVRNDLKELISSKGCGPIMIRLSWHDAGTYDKNTHTGGPRACMRFAGKGESSYACNTGLDIARNLLKPVREKYDEKEVTSADLWTLAAIVAVEVMGGPVVPFRPGRSDAKSADESVEDGRLPDASKGADHVRYILGRIGMSDREMVALVGAHTVGRCRLERSGYVGPWTHNPLKFDNEYFKLLKEKKWVPKTNEKGNEQFHIEGEENSDLMMLPGDMALVEDEEFGAIVAEYAEDEAAFFKDFASAFQKLQEAGVKNLKPVVHFATGSPKKSAASPPASPSKKPEVAAPPASPKKEAPVTPASPKKDASAPASPKKDSTAESPKKDGADAPATSPKKAAIPPPAAADDEDAEMGGGDDAPVIDDDEDASVHEEDDDDEEDYEESPKRGAKKGKKRGAPARARKRTPSQRTRSTSSRPATRSQTKKQKTK
eukprot:TRINITY_DN4220_c0_g1_i1.p1 TRINITY_DN4220_c0_g1~~TRINITY_DN4220_c0_g1_i1.p1  ORF type:complete len:435 (-),score=158.23 TRINITY_DN4220_c0_g1_i1:69-1373(-)